MAFRAVADSYLGGNIEIAAMSDLYNVGIKVWELDQSGKLTSPFDTTTIAVSKDLGTLHLAVECITIALSRKT